MMRRGRNERKFVRLYFNNGRRQLFNPCATAYVNSKTDQESVFPVVSLLCAVCDFGGDDFSGDCSTASGILALIIGVIMAWRGAGLFKVALSCCAIVLVSEFFLI